MRRLARRGVATALDLVLASAVCVAGLRWAASATGTPYPFGGVWFPALLCAVVISAAMSASGVSRSPGRWLLGIEHVGGGCALCREARKYLPALPWAGLLFAEALFGVYLPGWVLITALALPIAVLALPILRHKPDFWHNLSTGFELAERSR